MDEAQTTMAVGVGCQYSKHAAQRMVREYLSWKSNNQKQRTDTFSALKHVVQYCGCIGIVTICWRVSSHLTLRLISPLSVANNKKHCFIRRETIVQGLSFSLNLGLLGFATTSFLSSAWLQPRQHATCAHTHLGWRPFGRTSFLRRHCQGKR